MRRRWLVLLLAPIGSLVAHGLAYGFHTEDDALHHYLDLLGPLVAVAGLVLLAWAGTARPRPALPGIPALVALQVGVFLLQETGERLAHDVPISELAAVPAVRLGVALQVLVATTLLVAVRLLRRLWTAAVLWGEPCWFPAELTGGAVASLAVASASVFAPGTPPRGPPVVA